MKYCSNCGAKVELTIPPGDDRPRYVCDTCRTVHYDNPKMVVGCIPEWEDRILLCRRAIEPRHGFWTAPAGYLENGETLAEGARREAFEEARARVEIVAPCALLEITPVHQIYVIFRSLLLNHDFMPTRESLELKLFEEGEIPWDEIAFASIRESLRLYFEDRSKGRQAFHTGMITKREEGLKLKEGFLFTYPLGQGSTQ